MLVALALEGPDGMQRDMEAWLESRQWVAGQLARLGE